MDSAVRSTEDDVLVDESTYGGKSTTVRKLRIKIKVPERICEEDGDGRKEDEKVDHHHLHVCSLCGKGFGSRKALGGHMRVHAQIRATAVDEMKISTTVVVVDNRAGSNSSDMEDEAAGGEDDNKSICCPICQRDFPSNKALFGHMRCHPERSWRGIQPPPPPIYSSSSTLSSDVNKSDNDDVNNVDLMEGEEIKRSTVENELVVVDLEKDLLGFGWGAKAIRGKEAAAGADVKKSSCVSDDLVESMAPEQVDGVQSLILLSRGGIVENSEKLEELPPAGAAGVVVRDCSVNFMDKKLVFCGADSTKICGGDDSEISGKKRKNSHLLTAEEVVVTGLTDSNKKLKVANSDLKGSGTGGLMEDDMPMREAADAPQHGYFEMQHKVRKYVMVNDLRAAMSDTLPSTAQSLPAKKTDRRQVVNLDQAVASSERYKCTTCNKTFSSHQALGGHKSSHNKSRNTPSSFRPNNDHIIHPPHADQNVITAQGQEIIEAAGSSHGLLTVAGHQCNVCFKMYPSGQALGGHKRLHCGSSSLISKAPPQSPSIVFVAEAALPHPIPESVAAPADHNNDGVFSFDLNELPPLEDDQEAITIQPTADNGQPRQEAADDLPPVPSAQVLS